METEQIGLAAAATRDRLLAQLGAQGLDRLQRFVKAATTLGPYDHYKDFPAEAQRVVAEVHAEGGAAASRAFLRAAIAHAMAATLGSDHFARLPARVRAQQIGQFQRIAADGDEHADWLDIDKDLFHKEFGIVTLRLYVAGAQLVDPRCGIPRSVLLRGTPLDWLRNAAMVVALKGYRPYFQIHTHKFMLDTFNEAGWEECYRCCAELYDLHPEVLGMFGSSWFYDPALEAISPRLAYLRKTPQLGGAHVLYVETGGDTANNSLSTSPTRRQLHEQGKYQPKSYMLVWGRQQQRAWARTAGDSVPVAV